MILVLGILNYLCQKFQALFSCTLSKRKIRLFNLMISAWYVEVAFPINAKFVPSRIQVFVFFLLLIYVFFKNNYKHRLQLFKD